MGNDLTLASDLESMLGAEPAFEQLPMPPIRLTPRTPYVMGRAALVFAKPHWLNPADDIAWFGLTPTEPGGDPEMPHPGAAVEVWFKIPKTERKYSVGFSCVGEYGQLFTLASSLTSWQLPPINQSAESGVTLISTNFLNRSSGSWWNWFSVSNDFPWRFKSLEITELP